MLRNPSSNWREGMVSGNGLQGFVTSGAPYNDTVDEFFITQVDFVALAEIRHTRYIVHRQSSVDFDSGVHRLLRYLRRRRKKARCFDNAERGAICVDFDSGVRRRNLAY